MTKNSYLVRADARRFGRKVITTSTSVGEGSLFNEPELDEGERKETADQIRGGSATCDLARLRKWRLIFGCVTRGGRARPLAIFLCLFRALNQRLRRKIWQTIARAHISNSTDAQAAWERRPTLILQACASK